MGHPCPACGALVQRKGARGPVPTYCNAVCKTAYWKRANPEASKRTAQRIAEKRKAVKVPCPYCQCLRRPHVNTCGAADCKRQDVNRRQREFQAKYKDEHGLRHRALFGKAMKPGGRARNPETYARNDRVRRARKVGVDVEPFDHLDVFERDRWRCALCSKPVDSTLVYPDPYSASLDHIVPLSSGGAHRRANAQLAHLVCNLRKGKRGGPAQLALIG